MKWKPPPESSVTIDESINLASFSLGDLSVKQRSEKLSSGIYSRLTLTLVLERSIGFYMIQIYLPSMLVVVISWVSFWVTRESAPARVTLGVTTVLTITTLITTTNRAMPPVSYVKAVDVYLSVCYFFVFAALFEFALVSYSGKQKKEKSRRQGVPQQSSPKPDPLCSVSAPTLSYFRRQETSLTDNFRGSAAVCTCTTTPNFMGGGPASPPTLENNVNCEMNCLLLPPPLSERRGVGLMAIETADFDESALLPNGSHLQPKNYQSTHLRLQQPSAQFRFPSSENPRPIRRLNNKKSAAACQNHFRGGEQKIVVSQDGDKKNTTIIGRSPHHASSNKIVSAKLERSRRQQKNKSVRSGGMIRYDAAAVDRYSRFLFPLMFLLFNATYWSVYLVQRNEGRDPSADGDNKTYGIL